MRTCTLTEQLSKCQYDKIIFIHPGSIILLVHLRTKPLSFTDSYIIYVFSYLLIKCSMSLNVFSSPSLKQLACSLTGWTINISLFVLIFLCCILHFQLVFVLCPVRSNRFLPTVDFIPRMLRTGFLIYSWTVLLFTKFDYRIHNG